jgi:hypothetical protein
MYLLIALLCLWIIGAAVTVKADAMLANYKTEWYENLVPSLFVWPLIAILICTTKHACYSEGRYDGREYHY